MNFMFIRSVCMKQLGSHRNDFNENFKFENFSKIFLENSIYIKIWQEYPVLHTKTDIPF